MSLKMLKLIAAKSLWATLQQSCDHFRIEGNQMEDRTMNKMWLVRHLEVTRQLVLEDLRVVKV
jgi:hypothetical protein